MLSRMKTLFYGILFIILIGFGGFMYKNVVERSSQPIACPMDAKMCPDGTSIARTGLSCTFAECLPPNVTLSDASISYAIPEGFVSAELFDDTSIATYEMPGPTPEEPSSIVVRRYAITASSTALATIQATAIGGASGEPVPAMLFSSSIIGARRFTVVSIERFEGVIDTAYYLARGTDVLRFDAIDRGVDWTNPQLDISTLPAHKALIKLLGGLQGI